MKFDVRADGTTAYTTVDGDMVDLVAFRYYGTHDDTTALVYEANPGLADRGMVLPTSVVIVMPRRDSGQRLIEQISLFD